MDLPVDLPVTGAALTVWLGSELLKSHLAPAACRWCAPNGIDSGVRSAVRWRDRPGSAITASNLAAYAVAPLVDVGLTAVLASRHPQGLGQLWVDALLMTEAVALAGDLDQLVKFTVGRQRPFARAGLPNPDTSQSRADNNLSFYSGHTSFTFSLAASAGGIATLRGYRWAPVVWVVGGLIAATTGYLRIAADQHYFTDVLTGAALGTGVGLTVPYGLHRRRARAAPARASMMIRPSQGGASLIYAGDW